MQGIRRRKRARGRWVDSACVALWVVALAAVGIGAACGIGRAIRSQQIVPSLREVVLPRGGTVWGLAVRYRAAGQDPRAVAAQIRRLNGMRPGQVVHPGTHLLVPDYAAGATALAQNPHEPG